MLYSDGLHFVANGQLVKAGDAPVKYSGMVARIYVGETVTIGSIVQPQSAAQAFMRTLATAASVEAPGIAMCLQARTGAGYVLALFNGYVDYKTWATTPTYGTKATTTITADGNMSTNDEININGKVYWVRVGSEAQTFTGTALAAATLGNLVRLNMATLGKAVFQTAFDPLMAIHNPELEITTAWNSDDLVISFKEAGAHGNLAVTTKTTGANLAFTSTVFGSGVGTGVLYLEEGATTGLFTLTAPDTSSDIIQVLGHAIDGGGIFFNPVTDYDTIA